MVCAWLCVIAYLWPVLHVLGRTYEGIESAFLSIIVLLPALPLGTMCGIAGIAMSDPGSATSKRSGWALTLIWLFPVALILAVLVITSRTA